MVIIAIQHQAWFGKNNLQFSVIIQQANALITSLDCCLLSSHCNLSNCREGWNHTYSKLETFCTIAIISLMLAYLFCAYL
jgi:hypothetical protein